MTPNIISTTDTLERSVQPYLFVSDQKGDVNFNFILKFSLRAFTDLCLWTADLFYKNGKRTGGGLYQNHLSYTPASVKVGNRRKSQNNEHPQTNLAHKYSKEK